VSNVSRNRGFAKKLAKIAKEQGPEAAKRFAAGGARPFRAPPVPLRAGRSSLSSYLRSIMKTFKPTHGEVLAGARFLTLVSSDDGLVAAKLSRLRKEVVDHRQASADGFDVVARGFAKMTLPPEDATDEARAAFVAAPIVKMSEAVAAKDGQPERKAEEQFYQLSNTKAYVLYDESEETKKKFDEATDAYLKGVVEITAPELTADDMRHVIVAGPGGQKMPIPPNVADVLAPYAPDF
jgi:hypothetical protein